MKKIILCGGGTLGHTTPNIALFEELHNDYLFVYLTTKNGLEKEVVNKLMPTYEIETAKLVRSFSIKNILIPFKLVKGILQAKKIIKKEQPALIFSKGGYASVPVVIAGKMLKIPCITHESDISLGLANKIIAKKCKFVCTSFEQTSLKIKNGKYTGNLIRNQILNGNKEKIIQKFSLDTSKITILIVGGSLGSNLINTTLRQSLPYLKDYNILHITGKNKIDNSYKQLNYHQIEFANDIENYYACADLVVTRGGSNTLFELLYLNKNMLIIPLGKKASRGDQILNALEFKSKGIANVILEEELNKETFVRQIKNSLANDKIYMQNMKSIYKNGNKEVAKIIDDLLNK